jgi:hypothetical protein
MGELAKPHSHTDTNIQKEGTAVSPKKKTTTKSKPKAQIEEWMHVVI